MAVPPAAPRAPPGSARRACARRRARRTTAARRALRRHRRHRVDGRLDGLVLGVVVGHVLERSRVARLLHEAADAAAHAEALPKMEYEDAVAHQRKHSAAGQRLHARPRTHDDLVDPYEPRMPETRDGEVEAAFNRRMAAYGRRRNKRIDERQSKRVNQKKCATSWRN